MSLPEHYYRVEVSTAAGASGEAYFEQLADAQEWGFTRADHGAHVEISQYGKSLDLGPKAGDASVEPELDLHDQIQARRKHECPDCGSDTDTDYSVGQHGNEHFECCTKCEWYQELGTVTESLS